MTSHEARQRAKPGCLECGGSGLIRSQSERGGRRLRSTRGCPCAASKCRTCRASLGHKNKSGLCATCNKRELIKSARGKRKIAQRKRRRLEAAEQHVRHAEADARAVEAARTSLYGSGIDDAPPQPLAAIVREHTSRSGAGWLFVGGGR